MATKLLCGGSNNAKIPDLPQRFAQLPYERWAEIFLPEYRGIPSQRDWSAIAR